MSVHFHDTYRHRKVPFESIKEGEARIYSCGPTVYNYAHIGNYRSYVFSDLLRRWLEVRGYKVVHVVNITDVDDKTIRKSREEGVPLSDITSKYRDAYLDDLATLNVKKAFVYPQATAHIEEMVDLVESLLEKGHAYRAEDGSIYFRVSSYADYGNLSGKRLEDLRTGDRVTVEDTDSKDDVRDFALWKAWDADDGDVFWDTRIGKGRPGWHIECSAMSMKYLGEDFDIHTGGEDLIFPHHENEIAQSRCGTGRNFAKYWIHCDYLIVEGRKMSKSLGNFFTLRELLDKGYRAREVRYVLAGTHHRSQLNFTMDGLTAARAALNRLDEFHDSWASYRKGDSTAEVGEALDRADKAFSEAMDDDLNVSAALASIFNAVREVNALAVRNVPTSEDVPALEALWERWDNALGLLHPFDDEVLDDGEEVAWIEQKIADRNAARKAKEWSKADEIRDELAAKGILLKDGPEGTTWKRN